MRGRRQTCPYCSNRSRAETWRPDQHRLWRLLRARRMGGTRPSSEYDARTRRRVQPARRRWPRKATARGADWGTFAARRSSASSDGRMSKHSVASRSSIPGQHRRQTAARTMRAGNSRVTSTARGCPVCGASLAGHRADARFRSPACRREHHDALERRRNKGTALDSQRAPSKLSHEVIRVRLPCSLTIQCKRASESRRRSAARVRFSALLLIRLVLLVL